MPIETEIIEKLRQELRRGTLILAVLATLRREHFGYSLRIELEKRNVEIEERVLYPMLRRLEKQGLLQSEWRDDAKRQKRFYRLSVDGAEALDVLTVEWRKLNTAISEILSENFSDNLKEEGE